MSDSFLAFADWFFLIFHTVFTLFNVFGWIFKKVRKIQLVTMLATSFSWFVLGICYGFGYCFCTHWHWLVRQKLGKPIHSHSYIHFLIRELTGVSLNPDLVDFTVIVVFIIVALLTVLINLGDYIKKK